MNYEEFREIGILLNGGSVAGWKINLATTLNKGLSTIRRWSQNSDLIPASSENHMKALAHDLKAQIKIIGEHLQTEKTLNLPIINVSELPQKQKEELKQWCFNCLDNLTK